MRKGTKTELKTELLEKEISHGHGHGHGEFEFGEVFVH
jgi:hypothetical protein